MPVHVFPCSFTVKGSSREKNRFLVQDYLFDSSREFLKFALLCFSFLQMWKLLNFFFEITVLIIIGEVFICFNRQ